MAVRKRCQTCDKPLIAFQGHYLHPDSPCAGIRDNIFIEATIEDESLYKHFEKMYGTPDMDDYERLALYEKHKELLIEAIRKRDAKLDKYKKIIVHPIIKPIIKLFRLV